MIDYGFLNDFLPKYAKWICVRKTIDGSELLLENGKSSLLVRSRAEKRTFMYSQELPWAHRRGAALDFLQGRERWRHAAVHHRKAGRGSCLFCDQVLLPP